MGTKTLEPGQSTELTFSTRMSRGMGGMHIFEATIASDDPDPAQNSVQIKVNYEE